MAFIRESEFISDAELRRMVERGGKRLFWTSWDEYKDSPYAIYARKLEELGYGKSENANKRDR